MKWAPVLALLSIPDFPHPTLEVGLGLDTTLRVDPSFLSSQSSFSLYL